MSFLEQYEAFLKFNHDQIQRRFNGDTTASCKFLFIRTQVSYRILGRGYFSTSLFAGYKYTEIEGRGSHLK